jgi:hypothetical protein
MTNDDLSRVMGNREESAEWIAERSQLPQFSGRKVHVFVRIAPDQARFAIRHEGPPLSLAPVNADAGSLEDQTDRSLILMRAFMDEIQFLEDGQEWRMVKRRLGAAS